MSRRKTTGSNHSSPTATTTTQADLEWLGRQLLTPAEVCAIGRGELDIARSMITASCRGRAGGQGWYVTEGQWVRYGRGRYGQEDGRVKVIAIVRWAAAILTDAAVARVRAAYDDYINVPCSSYTLARSSKTYQEDPEGNEARAAEWARASRALDAATRDALDPPTEPGAFRTIGDQYTLL